MSKILIIDGREYNVPQHTSRRKIGRGGYAWSIFFRRDTLKINKSFFDNTYGGTWEAYKAMIMTLVEIEDHYGINDKLVSNRRGAKPSVYWLKKSKYNIWFCRVAITLVNVNKRNRKVTYYIGNTNTITQEKVNYAFDKAIASWDWANHIIMEHGRDYLKTLSNPTVEELEPFLALEHEYEYPTVEELLDKLKIQRVRHDERNKK